MSLELKANIAALIIAEALVFMAQKGSVEPTVILEAIVADPEGNTARYFNGLVDNAMREVPKLLAV